MLSELWGRPFTIESRLPPGVCTPGRNVTKSRVLRLATGRLAIWFVPMVDAAADDCVWITSVAPSTTTVSVRPPTSSTARTVPGAPAVTTTSLSTAVLNPWRETLTVYLPAMRLGIVKVPLAAVIAVDVPAVASLVAVTEAPGITPPPESTTVPEMDEFEVPWANAGALTSAMASTISRTLTGRSWLLNIRSSGLGPELDRSQM